MIKTYDYVTVLAGSRLMIQAPGWDGDRPETQKNLEVVLFSDIVVSVADEVTGNQMRVINTFDDKDPVV